MNRDKLIDFILERNGIDKIVFQKAFLDCDEFPSAIYILRVLQEIDITVFSYFFPYEDSDEIQEISKVKKDLSIFSAETIADLMTAKRLLINKLVEFFKVVRFSPIKDELHFKNTKDFINEFTSRKKNLLTI